MFQGQTSSLVNRSIVARITARAKRITDEAAYKPREGGKEAARDASGIVVPRSS